MQYLVLWLRREDQASRNATREKKEKKEKTERKNKKKSGKKGVPKRQKWATKECTHWPREYWRAALECVVFLGGKVTFLDVIVPQGIR